MLLHFGFVAMWLHVDSTGFRPRGVRSSAGVGGRYDDSASSIRSVAPSLPRCLLDGWS